VEPRDHGLEHEADVRPGRRKLRPIRKFERQPSPLARPRRISAAALQASHRIYPSEIAHALQISVIGAHGQQSPTSLHSDRWGGRPPSGIDAIMRVVRTGNKGAAYDEH
jgi:hypothetical protein